MVNSKRFLCIILLFKINLCLCASEGIKGQVSLHSQPWLVNRNTNADSKILPVTIIAFKATGNENRVTIFWQTSSEVNIAAYEIESGRGPENFTSIGAVIAKKSSGGETYEFFNTPGFWGIIYYRLKIIEKDGSFTYGDTATVQLISTQSKSVFDSYLFSKRMQP
jgi:hypothetical protein